jgi:hypothetical protein
MLAEGLGDFRMATATSGIAYVSNAWTSVLVDRAGICLLETHVWSTPPRCQDGQSYHDRQDDEHERDFPSSRRSLLRGGINYLIHKDMLIITWRAAIGRGEPCKKWSRHSLHDPTRATTHGK